MGVAAANRLRQVSAAMRIIATVGEFTATDLSGLVFLPVAWSFGAVVLAGRDGQFCLSKSSLDAALQPVEPAIRCRREIKVRVNASSAERRLCSLRLRASFEASMPVERTSSPFSSSVCTTASERLQRLRDHRGLALATALARWHEVRVRNGRTDRASAQTRHRPGRAFGILGRIHRPVAEPYECGVSAGDARHLRFPS